MIDLVQELEEIKKALPDAVHDIAKYGHDCAMYEKQYRVLVRQEILKAQADGTPATLIKDLVRGIDAVANAKFNKDCADAYYKAAQENVNIKKLQAKLDEEAIKREWGQHD